MQRDYGFCRCWWCGGLRKNYHIGLCEEDTNHLSQIIVPHVKGQGLDGGQYAKYWHNLKVLICEMGFTPSDQVAIVFKQTENRACKEVYPEKAAFILMDQYKIKPKKDINLAEEQYPKNHFKLDKSQMRRGSMPRNLPRVAHLVHSPDYGSF